MLNENALISFNTFIETVCFSCIVQWFHEMFELTAKLLTASPWFFVRFLKLFAQNMIKLFGLIEFDVSCEREIERELKTVSLERVLLDKAPAKAST